MKGIFDTVTAALEEFAQKNIFSLFDECYAYAWNDASGFVYPPMDTFRANPQQIEEVNQQLMKRLKSICENHPLFELLILSRKVPISIASAFLQKFGSTYASQTTGLFFLFIESMLFSTNCALMYSPNNLTIQEVRERNFIKPSDEEMSDAIRLILFSFLHRHNMFCLNSIARRDLTVETSFGHLLELYNQRMRAHLKARVSNEADAVFVLALIQHLPFSNIIHVFEKNVPYSLFLQNYFPVPIDGSDLRKEFAYLESEKFTTRMGMSFQEFWKSWVVLNKLVLWQLPNRWTPGEIYKIDSKDERLRLERLFDICETGLGGGSLSYIKETCFDSLSEHYPDLMPSKFNYQKFIDTVICERLDKRRVVEFIEQPYVFYKVGPDAVLWDHLRHRGIFKAIARDILPLSGAIGNRKGEAFEKTVEEKIRTIVEEVQYVKRNIKIKSDNKAKVELEIDIGFIYKGVLFLLEVKSNFKPIQYYNAKGVLVSDRIKDIENRLFKRDKKLVKHAEDIRKKWSEADILGAIYVYCTDEVEFIPSFNVDFWFKVGQYSRICFIDEFIDFLQNMDLADLLNHPCFVKLSS